MNYIVTIIVLGVLIITKLICQTIERLHGIDRDFSIDISPAGDDEDDDEE